MRCSIKHVRYPFHCARTHRSSSTYRFRGMPTGGRSDSGTGLCYYSWEAGPIHYISVDSFYVLYLKGLPLVDWVVAGGWYVDGNLLQPIVAGAGFRLDTHA